jgi:hypothetical protein
MDMSAGLASPVCAVSGADALPDDSWSSVIFSSASTRTALYSLRACVEEPALHVYSELRTHTTHTTLRCISYSDGHVFEVEIDIYRLVLPSWTEGARTYMARFRLVPCEGEETEEPAEEAKWTLVQKLVRRAQHMLWARDLETAATRRSATCGGGSTRPNT